MALIKSISGIRGTIGGHTVENLTPLDIVKFTAAFGSWVKGNALNKKCKIVVGRDARISGSMVNALVNGTLMGLGIDVIDTGLATTPTVEIAVIELSADGGIILTASHNPRQWNALKLLNNNGEFISETDGKEVLKIAESEKFIFSDIDSLGIIIGNNLMDDLHIKKILSLSLVDVKAIRQANFRIAIDCVNSVGGKILPKLLKELGVVDLIELNCTPNGQFPHNPEPLPEHLTEISNAVVQHRANLGFVVDPDVDRLAIINEDGSMFGEEYTIVAIADYVLSHKAGNTVSNLSSTRALCDVTEEKGGKYFASAVGEVNVVKAMKQNNAVIGGEGNGGVIYPELHYGRDALVGIALFLAHLAKSKKKCSQLRALYPFYFISKNRIELSGEIDVDSVLSEMKKLYSGKKINDIDGLRIDFDEEWVHLRKSNTEPIIRIYAESIEEEKAKKLAQKTIDEIRKIIG
jgi:phosphomannomutase